MLRRAVLVFLALTGPLLLVASVVDGPVARWTFALVAAALPVALIALAVARRGRLGPLTGPLALLLALLAGGLAGILALAGRAAEAPWPGGLPLAAALQLFVLGLVPLALVGLAYAMTFDRGPGITTADLDHLRSLRQTPVADGATDRDGSG